MFDDWITIAFIFLFITLALLITGIIYYFFGRRQVVTQSCNTTRDCPVDQICSRNVCIRQACTSDTDCSGICHQGFCLPLSCTISNDCPPSATCLNNVCVNIDTPCTSASDCRTGLTCRDNKCIQCTDSCPTGLGCFDHVCRYPTEEDLFPPTVLFYDSPAIDRGNVVAPPGYYCEVSVCGVTGSNAPLPCSASTECPSTCPFCVNGVCRCTAGELYENCINANDCLTKQCRPSSFGNICFPVGASCAFNYDGSGATGTCPIGSPYCVNGLCRETSAGAYCAGTNPHDVCTNPNALKLFLPLEPVTDPLALAPSSGMKFFCVNGICQEDPGSLNDLCAGPNSCAIYNSQFLVCHAERCQSQS
jgi:hypothetical protein